nr:hypothetical protein Iba_chr01aCG17260 [Ipomoea batatas]GMC69547.1 hypothetical protein Iba_chr03aCG7590 [Ipomoea batatas]
MEMMMMRKWGRVEMVFKGIGIACRLSRSKSIFTSGWSGRGVKWRAECGSQTKDQMEESGIWPGRGAKRMVELRSQAEG